jgi:glycosyltransferase involved in cell wall biosynthesis
MSKKIICITSSFPFGKLEVWAGNELNSLLEQGNEIIVIPRTGKGKVINEDALKFIPNVIDLPFLNWAMLVSMLIYVFSKPILLFKLLSEIIKQSNNVVDVMKGIIVLPKSLFLVKMLANQKVDHIHSYSTSSAAIMAFVLSSYLKVPWSYTLHTSAQLNNRFKRSYLFQADSASICRTISQRTAIELSTFIGPDLSRKIRKVHLGVKTVVELKERTKTNTPFIIATPAVFLEYKGHAYAIDAARELINMGINGFKWFFYGSGPLLRDIQHKAQKLKLHNHCFFPGNIDHRELLDKYEDREIDLVVLTSITSGFQPEGIPVSLMEAMSYAVPVVATDSGGTLELIGDGAGVNVPQKDSINLAKEIKRFIEDNEYHDIQGNKGRKKIADDFDTKKTSIQLYNHIFKHGQ